MIEIPLINEYAEPIGRVYIDVYLAEWDGKRWHNTGITIKPGQKLELEPGKKYVLLFNAKSTHVGTLSAKLRMYNAWARTENVGTVDTHQQFVGEVFLQPMGKTPTYIEIRLYFKAPGCIANPYTLRFLAIPQGYKGPLPHHYEPKPHPSHDARRPRKKREKPSETHPPRHPEHQITKPVLNKDNLSKAAIIAAILAGLYYLSR